jgi:peptidyl-dipeptidase Dcp
VKDVGQQSFFEISLLPYQAPHFDEINDSHYRPAFDEAIRQKRADIAAIVAQTAAPDFNNTVLALEKSGAMLSRVSSVFFAMTSAHTNDDLQELDEQFSTELAGLANDIWLNETLFTRVESVWQDRAALDAESRRLVEETYQHFILAGARLNDAGKTELKALNTESALLTSQFNQRLLAADKTGGLVVDYAHQLEGLSADEMATAAQAAAEKGLNDRWLIPLLNTTQQPALSALTDRQTRENLFNAGWVRTQKGDENDTRELILRLVALRARQAHLLGFDDYASWSIADQMAKTLQQRWHLCAVSCRRRARAEREQADIQKVIDDEQGGFTVQAWDWSFYAERVRLGKYALDESQINRTLPSIPCCMTASSGRPASCLASVLSSVLIFRSITRTCAYGKSLTTPVKAWRCSTVISSPGIPKAVARGWGILSSNRMSVLRVRLSTTSVTIKNRLTDRRR